MKCEHGKTITVVLTPYYDCMWDGGFDEFDKDGKKVRQENGHYLKVRGCDKCKLIKFFADWDRKLEESKL